MINYILFIIQLIILFLLARSFAKNFFRFWFLLTKSRDWSLRFTSLFLLPGTIIHELSHWAVAEILQVPTGKITLWPEINKHLFDKNEQTNNITPFFKGGKAAQRARGFHKTKSFKFGSVAIAKADPFRRTLIGLAPLFVGLVIITLAATVIPTSVGTSFKLVPTIIAIGIIFLTSNTMFSSPKDLEAAFIPFFLLILAVLFFWYADITIPQTAVAAFSETLTKLNYAFFITIIIDLVFLLLVKILTTLFGKMLKRKII